MFYMICYIFLLKANRQGESKSCVLFQPLERNIKKVAKRVRMIFFLQVSTRHSIASFRRLFLGNYVLVVCSVAVSGCPGFRSSVQGSPTTQRVDLAARASRV